VRPLRVALGRRPSPLARPAFAVPRPSRTNHGAIVRASPLIVPALDGGRYVCDDVAAEPLRFVYVPPPALVFDRDDWPAMHVGAVDNVAEPLDLDRVRRALVRGFDVWIDGDLGPATAPLWVATLAELNCALDATGRTWPLDPSTPVGDSGSLHTTFARGSYVEVVPGAGDYNFGEDWCAWPAP
jgi:hypothetical protein